MVGYKVRLLQVLLLSGVVCILAPPLTVQARGSWTNGEFAWGERSKYSGKGQDEQKCAPTWVRIIGVDVETDAASVCIYNRPSFRYGIYTKYIPAGYLSRWDSYFVVGKANDQNVYVVDNMNYQRLPLEVVGSDDLHFNTLTMGFTNNHLLTYIPDFPSKLKMVDPFGQLPHYHLDGGSEQPFIPHSQPQDVITGAVGVSENGEWMVVEVMGVGLIRIDTKTRKIDGFSNYVHQYGYGSDAHITFQVSNDGTEVAAFDYNISPVIYSLDSTCMLAVDKFSESFGVKLREGEGCPKDGERLYDALARKYPSYQLRSARAAAFNNDGDTLYFEDYVYEGETDEPIVYRTPLYAGGYVKEKGIEYLALGDSFTSGEGDIEKKSDGSPYYLPGTENKNECHVSERSYPFLLRQEKELDETRMHSVACSGAQVLPDYTASADSYLGQGKRLQSLSGTDREVVKSIALKSFAPGNIPQLEFVKKYRPKAITLMGGGNDVGFGSILQYCASPTWEMTVADDTCGYAVDGSPLRTMLAQSIQSQYEYTLLLLRKIKQASPETTVYVVGYPSFISEKPSLDCFNSAALDSSERTMINESVTFMNTMLEDAAASMGMHYIDIQDTLEGGRLCEGSEYVTGLSDLGPIKLLDKDIQESFHPNAKAHERIAARILAKNFQAEANRNTEVLPQALELEVPPYFGTVEQKQTAQRDITSDQMTEQSEMVVYMSDGSLAPGSDVTLTMFSNAVELGSVSADETGGVDTTVTLPALLKPGHHVLVLGGFSASGEPVQYFQFVTVVSQIPDDEDGDGILDADDRCLFITSWIDETTRQDVCLAAADEEQSGDDKTVITKSGYVTSIPQQLQQPSEEESATKPHTRPPILTPSPKTQDREVAVVGKEDSTIVIGRQEQQKSPELKYKAKVKDSTQLASPEVLGVRTEAVKDKEPKRENNEKWWLPLGTVAMLSTIFAGYGIVRVVIKGRV